MLTDVVQMILGNYAHDVITVLTKNDLRNVWGKSMWEQEEALWPFNAEFYCGVSDGWNLNKLQKYVCANINNCILTSKKELYKVKWAIPTRLSRQVISMLRQKMT